MLKLIKWKKRPLKTCFIFRGQMNHNHLMGIIMAIVSKSNGDDSIDNEKYTCIPPVLSLRVQL